MTDALPTLSQTEHRRHDDGLLATVVEVMYHAWQRNQSLTMETIVIRAQASWDNTTVPEVHNAIATLECLGMVETTETGTWQRAEFAHRTPVATCEHPGCRRPARHHFGHLPTNTRDEQPRIPEGRAR